jgi:hypothetical protein
LRAVPRRPTLVSATQPGAAVRANWPLHDLRNNPLDEQRPGACTRDEAAAVGSPGDSFLRASPHGPILVSATARGRRAGDVALARFAQQPSGRAPWGVPSGRRRLDCRATRPCPRRRAARPWPAPPGPRPPCEQICPCAICATTPGSSARGHALGCPGHVQGNSLPLRQDTMVGLVPRGGWRRAWLRRCGARRRPGRGNRASARNSRRCSGQQRGWSGRRHRVGVRRR